MPDVVRFTVSLEDDLLEEFDKYCKREHYATRSEAIRQLIRERLTAEAWEGKATEVAATLTIVYDHHRGNLTDQLLHLQHHHPDMVVCTTHVHLDHDNCLEVIVLRGSAKKLHDFAARLRGLKGIQQGKLVVAKTADVP